MSLSKLSVEKDSPFTRNELCINQCFNDCGEACLAIKNYCAQKFHPIKVNRSEINDRDSPNFYYNWITYTCIHGGKYKSKCTGIRPNQRSFASECPFKIHVRLIHKPSAHYKITQLYLEHNHEIGSGFYSLYPKHRQLNAEQKNDITDLVTYNISSKDLKLYVQEKMNKNLTSYDIKNLKANLLGTNNTNSKNSKLLIEELNNLIQNDNACNIHLETDENKIFQYLLIQTKMMKFLAEKFSSVLFVDATYRVNIEGFPLYTIMCEDSGGISRPICYIFVLNEKALIVKSALEKFVELNPSVLNLCKVIVTDKDFNEMNIIKGLFPKAHNILCIFHVLKYWRLKVSGLNLDNTSKENIRVILQQLLYSNDEEEYNQNLELLRLNSPDNFFSYFLKNWHSCKEKYVLAYTKKLQHLGNTTNNRIESHNQKIKAFLKPEMHLCTAVKELLNYIKTINNSLLHASFKELKCMTTKDPTNAHAKFGVLYTHKACTLIFEQIEKFKDGTFFIEIIDNNLHSVISKDKIYQVQNLISCTCSFHCQFALPCQHIFSVRFALGKDFFDEKLVSDRWMKPKFSSSTSFPKSVTKHVAAPSKIPQTGHDKFVYARIYTDRLATLLSQSGSKEFKEKIEFLSKLTQAWENNENVCLYKMGKNNNEALYSYTDCGISEKAPFHNIGNGESLNDEEIVASKDILASDLIIPSVKHRKGRARDAFPSFNVTSKKFKKVKISKEVTVKNTLNSHSQLSNEDYNDIINNDMLTDNVINLGQQMIKAKFPNSFGLQDVLLGSMLKFRTIDEEFVQVLHCGQFLHWVAASTIGANPNTIYIYDSLNESVPQDVVPQICNIMNTTSSSLTIISESMQIQENSVDCGLFALASIITLLNGENPSDKTYDTSLMRKHFLSCLEKGCIEDFPTTSNNTCKRSLRKIEKFNLCSICMLPMLDNVSYSNLRVWFNCKECKKSYHKTCKLNCCVPNKEIKGY